MIPQFSRASQSPDNSIDTHAHIDNGRDPIIELRNVVSFANENEMGMLVDRALRNGANINYYDCYDHHLMVIAVRSKQPHAIAILMARGLNTPDTEESGVDLLMDAAASGAEKLMRPLLDIANMDIFATDANGKTALHHAVIGGSVNIVEILLNQGALPNVFTSRMDDDELRTLFGDKHTLTGANITPLMIASAAGHDDIVSLLLAYDADPLQGESLPLLLASTQGHATTVNALLNYHSKPTFSTSEEHTLLATAIENGASLECLRLIAAHHCFDMDDGTVDSPLGAAIKSQKVSAVALMLASGAPIKKFSANEHTLWDEAFVKEKKLWELIDLLVTQSPWKIISEPDYLNENYLISFFNNCENPIPLAVLGFYPSIVVSAQEELRGLLTATLSWSKMEKQLLTAFILQCHLQKIPDEKKVVVQDSENYAADSQWLNTTAIKKQEQKYQLLEETDKFIKSQFNRLRYALTLEFFLECAALCPQKRSLKNFIANKLALEVGTPPEISEAIASIWSQGAQWATNWHVATRSIEESNRFLIHLTRNLLQKKFSSYSTDENNLYHQCHNAICDELSTKIDPLNNFCSNPVAWLRKCENRSNLRPVHENELANSLQLELGLPIGTCQAISNAWSKVITLARKSTQWKSPAELDRFLAVALAPLIEPCLSDELAQRIIPDQYVQSLSLWVGRVRNQSIRIDAQPGSLKRPATEEPDGAPPQKEARV